MHRRDGSGDVDPDFSVVIPCRNGAETLGAQLQAILDQDSEWTFEVVVADNGSSDCTVQLIDQFSARDDRVRRVDASDKTGINHARNAGVRAARGAFVLHCDADDIVQPGWLQAYGEAVRAGAVCVGGDVERTLPDGRVLSRDRTLMSLETSELVSPVGANCGFAREVFDTLGGFDEALFGGFDEVDFFWRAQHHGWPVTFVPDATVTYVLRTPLRAVFRQFFAYGRGEVRLYVKHRHSGMSRPASLRTLLRIPVIVWRLTVTRDADRRRVQVQTLAYLLGRIRESGAKRVVYL